MPGGPVWENNRARAEYVGLDVHLAPCLREVVHQAEIKFVCTGRVGELARAELLDECDLVVDAERDQERNDNTRDEELIATNVRWGLPVVQSTVPCVVLESRQPDQRER